MMSSSTRHLFWALAANFALMAGPSSAESEVELLMVEARGCIYCERWHAEVGPGFPATAEGKFAPLRRIDISDPFPDAINLTSRPVFTPTFILLAKGQEIGRIEGYPGEDFFWGLFARLLQTETDFSEGVS